MTSVSFLLGSVVKIAENVLCARVCEVSISVADVLKRGCFLLAYFRCESRSPAHHCTAEQQLVSVHENKKTNKRKVYLVRID